MSMLMSNELAHSELDYRAEHVRRRESLWSRIERRTWKAVR